ncbi:hypothetical protein JCM31271_31180 [Halorubrum trueperi]
MYDHQTLESMTKAGTVSSEESLTCVDGVVRLLGTQCQRCEEVTFPPRLQCPNCGSNDLDEMIFNRTGELETYSVVRVPQEGFEAPYTVGFVRLDPGDVRVFGPINSNPDDLEIGRSVAVTMITPAEGPVPEEMWGFTTDMEGST